MPFVHRRAPGFFDTAAVEPASGQATAITGGALRVNVVSAGATCSSTRRVARIAIPFIVSA